MHKLGRRNRDKVQQFMAMTRTSERVALKALKASNWHLVEAFHMFYGQPCTRTVVDSRHLEEFYNRYKDKFFLSDPCLDMILVDGMTLLCSDLQLVESWHMKAATMCEISRQEFIGGLRSLGQGITKRYRETRVVSATGVSLPKKW